MAQAVRISRSQQKSIDLVPIQPPPKAQQVRRDATFMPPEAKPSRYWLPKELRSASPVGYRKRVPLSQDEARSALNMLSLERPVEFVPGQAPSEGELFEEVSLGVLSQRQSTNFRGHKQITLGPDASRQAAAILRQLDGVEAPVLDRATHTHVVFTRPYRTAFTLLLTLIGHKLWLSPLGVAKRIWQKKFAQADDIPTIGYLQHLHVGILADAMDRAAVIASRGKRRAQVFMAPFCGAAKLHNREAVRSLEKLCGLTATERREGWRVALVAQVGHVSKDAQVNMPSELFRKLGANLLSFRSERIQPGVNNEPKAPPQYARRQDMDVPEEVTVMCGRAAYNAFAHWTSADREQAKQLVMLERIDVLTPLGKERLREIRQHLDSVTDKVIRNIPLWADLPTGRTFSRNAARGKKAFALAGQRVYIGGLSKQEIAAAGIDWPLALRAFGAGCARSALVAELFGVVDLPDTCDLLAGVCLMAGPVNQNDVGKTFYGDADLLKASFPDRDPTSLLVWTLKAKTIADPIGNEEQLLNAARQGALVDLRPGPHECVSLVVRDVRRPMRKDGNRFNEERAFADVGNFVTAPDGTPIAGNAGTPWPEHLRTASVWD